eukprot:3631289-Amphidinium_carterae.1
MATQLETSIYDTFAAQPEITSNFVKLGAVPTLEDAVMTDTSELPVQPRPPKRFTPEGEQEGVSSQSTTPFDRNVRVRLTTKTPAEHANRPPVQILPAQSESLPAQS